MRVEAKGKRRGAGGSGAAAVRPARSLHARCGCAMGLPAPGPELHREVGDAAHFALKTALGRRRCMAGQGARGAPPRRGGSS